MAPGFRSGAASAGRSIYRSIPLPERLKAPLKDVVYTVFGPVFHGTAAYAAWTEARTADSARSAARKPVARPRPGELPRADGRWEWVSYASVKARISQAQEAHVNRGQRRPRRLVRVDPRAIKASIGELSFEDPGLAPDVSIIVPVYGQLRYTVECLISIAVAGSQAHTFEVIVADDASPDDTQAALATVPNLRHVRQPENVGFLLNCNRAAQQAAGRLIVFLNNDAQVSGGWLDAMADVFAEEHDVGAVGPRIVYADGTLQEAGSRVRRDGSVEMIGLNGLPEDPGWTYRRDVDFVSGVCLMVEAATFRELGGFDTRLAPAYYEDVDLGLRLWERGLRSIYTPDAEVVHHLSVTSAAVSAEFKNRAIVRNAQLLAESHQATLDRLDDVRFVALYLPQFHPFPENDLWWGPGFTEWTNVAEARPNWKGHDQPRIPADLGFYDLRLPDTLEQQWRLAARYGVDAFCYYYYWFAGSRMLSLPLEPMLDPTRTAHPFCLCWANENWTRRWDGRDGDVLMAQQHSPQDDVAVIRDLMRYMEHPAYLRVRGRPLLLVYRVGLFPDFAATAERWRSECRRAGVGEIELAMVESFELAGADVNPATYGCDSAVEFPAHNIQRTTEPPGQLLNRQFAGAIADYGDAAVTKAARAHPGYRLYRGVLPGWDNTARRQDGPFVLSNPSPGAFQAWLESAIADTKRHFQGDERLVFINAWNEWAEAAYLEPDRRFGHTYLEALQNAHDLSRSSASGTS